jgi:hypothetical protein
MQCLITSREEVEPIPKEFEPNIEPLLNKFEPGSIHKEEYFNFWRDVLLAPEWVLNVLKDGYELPLKEWPEEYLERNNKTARDNMQIVRQIVSEMILAGVVYVVKQKPRIVSPLGLVTKIQEDGSSKHRLVYDASRHLNKFLEVPHVRLSHLERALEITEQDDFQVTFDLTSAYYHVKIKAEQQCLLGASFTNSDGEEIFFQYAHLPFGIASAVHVMTKIWKPITRYLNANGVRNTIYIDDGRLLAKTAEEAERSRIFAYEAISKAGWAIEIEKSDTKEKASQQKAYLGFEIDSVSMMVKATEKKLKKVERLINESLQMKKIPVKRMASIMGNIIALEPSHGMLARVATRSGYFLLAEHTEAMGWKGSIQPTESLEKELTFFLKELRLRNGSLIKNKNLEVRIETILPTPVAKTKILQNHVKGSEILVSDSSEFKTFVYNLNDTCTTELVGTFNEVEKTWSSGARELVAILWTLRQWKLKGITRRNVYWITDSENVVFFIQKGSRKPDIQNLIFEIVILSSELQVHIEPIHVLRQDPRIQVADAGSRILDSDNWSIDLPSFQELNVEFHFDIDMFADSKNARCKKFCSLYYNNDTSAIDAFSINWNSLGCMWICPPVSALIRIHKRILESSCEGVLVMPVWKTSSFYTLFFEKNDLQPKRPFQLVKLWSPYICQNENTKNTALFGQVNFQFAALYFNQKML